MSTRTLSDRFPTAFVSGASAGLGQAFVRALLDRGVEVWGSARDASRLSPFADTARFHPVVLDLASPEQAGAAFAGALAEAGGGFGLVVQNAGFGQFGAFADSSAAEWEAQLTAMLVSTSRLSRFALAPMLARHRGCLVHVSSLAAEFPIPFMSGYNVAKAGLIALGESLMAETRGSGVCVIDFRPGDYRTGFNDAMRPASARAGGESRESRVWACLERTLRAAPPPERAAADLVRAVDRGRSGVVRSGSFFQARLAPALAALGPSSWRRAVTARYFHLG